MHNAFKQFYYKHPDLTLAIVGFCLSIGPVIAVRNLFSFVSFMGDCGFDILESDSPLRVLIIFVACLITLCGCGLITEAYLNSLSATTAEERHARF